MESSHGVLVLVVMDVVLDRVDGVADCGNVTLNRGPVVLLVRYLIVVAPVDDLKMVAGRQ